MPIKSLPVRPSLELDKKAAKRLLRAARDHDADALARIAQSHPREIAPGALKLADVEMVLAREYGFASWPRYKHFVEAVRADQTTRAATLLDAICENQLTRGLALLQHEPELARFDFYTACACGELEVALVALAKDPTLATRVGGAKKWEPLVYTCFSRFWRHDPARRTRLLTIVRELLARGASPNGHYFVEHDGKPEVQTCLYAAAGIANDADLTKLLLDAGADADELGSNEALYHACEFKDVRCLQLLLEAKPKKETVSYCLSRALDFDNEVAALLFLEHGADANLAVRWHEQRTHLHKAIMGRRSLRTIEALLERGADPNLADAHGSSPYRYAVRRGETAIAELLERFGADRSSVTVEDRAASPDADMLARAARRNDIAEMERLLAAGIDVNAALDVPALHSACYAGHLEAARVLFAKGASLTQKNAYGGTPLGTCIYGSLDCCDPEGGPGTLSAEEIAPRDYAALTEWLLASGSPRPERIRGGSEAVQEMLRRYGVPDGD